MNAVKRLLIAVVGGLALSASVSAQTPATAPKSDTTAAETKAAVAQLLAAINFREMMNQMAASMAQSMPQMLAQSTPPVSDKLSPEQQKAVKERSAASTKAAMENAMAIYRDPEIVRGMEDIMGRAYAKRFTLAEIKAITAFYTSDAGKKMLSSGPQIMQEAMPEIMALTSPKVNALMSEVMKKAAEDVKAVSETKNAPATK